MQLSLSALAGLLAIIAPTLAAPLEVEAHANGTATLEKRVTHTGRGTYFEVGLGACGYTNVDSDPIVAISSQIYGSGGNCNQWVKITDTATGHTAYGLTRDECPGCGAGDLDMSPGLFQQFASLSVGVIPISWNFEPKGFTPP